MPESASKPCVLLRLAAEALVARLDEPDIEELALGGAPANQRAVNRFGFHILQRWQEWLKSLPLDQRRSAVAELSALTPQEARREAELLLADLAPNHNVSDRQSAAAYLAAIPAIARRLMLEDTVSRAPGAVATQTFADAADLLPMLPIDAPPYSAPCALSGTHYHLDELVGTGGFGVVYRASAPSLQHLPFAIKFCLDHSQVVALQQERANLERLMKAGAEPGAAHIVRLYGYDLEHATPYLVYEYVADGDLLRYLDQTRQRLGRPSTADEALAIIRQILAGLAFAHGKGLVHRDIKPANILVAGTTFKLADFGLGGVAAERAARASRLTATATLAEQASLFRRAGTPLYMSPEQRMGFAADPRHDLYSLGVMWYQILVGDMSRELHAGWAKELALRFQVPQNHVGLIERCVGWFEERPKDAGELLALMINEAPDQPTPTELPPTLRTTASALPREAFRRHRLASLLTQVRQSQEELRRAEQQLRARRVSPAWIIGIYLLASATVVVILLLLYGAVTK
jgi:serine/threonine protein kinase